MILEMAILGFSGLLSGVGLVVCFVAGYHATARMIINRSENRSRNRDTKRSDRIKKSWNLSAEEVEEIEDWEKFEEYVEE